MTHLDHEGDLNVTELMRRLFEKGSKARMLSQAYHRYALNYINALNYLESLRRHNDFCDFEKVFKKAGYSIGKLKSRSKEKLKG